MKRIFFISDTHFHHGNILNFVTQSGNPVRPGFSNVKEMNQYMIDHWNSVVRPSDQVYHLGDVVMKESAWAFEIIEKLNGTKVLIKGNHDTAPLNRYSDHFKDVRSEIMLKTGEKDRVIFSHRPIRIPEDMMIFNVHGHIHEKSLDDPRYFNVSVERIGYTPIQWEELHKTLLAQKEKIVRKADAVEKVWELERVLH